MRPVCRVAHRVVLTAAAFVIIGGLAKPAEARRQLSLEERRFVQRDPLPMLAFGVGLPTASMERPYGQYQQQPVLAPDGAFILPERRPPDRNHLRRVYTDGLTAYGYLRANPVVWTDALGLCANVPAQSPISPIYPTAAECEVGLAGHPVSGDSTQSCICVAVPPFGGVPGGWVYDCSTCSGQCGCWGGFQEHCVFNESDAATGLALCGCSISI